jgi:hypothetical protein
MTAADTARQSAALLTARAQSIDDNRRTAHQALTMRANATRAAKNNDIPRGGPAWQAHLDELHHADTQLAHARAADADSAATTARKAAALHWELPTTRLLADTLTTRGIHHHPARPRAQRPAASHWHPRRHRSNSPAHPSAGFTTRGRPDPAHGPSSAGPEQQRFPRRPRQSCTRSTESRAGLEFGEATVAPESRKRVEPDDQPR